MNSSSFTDTDEAKSYRKHNIKRQGFVQPKKPESFDSSVMLDSQFTNRDDSIIKKTEKRKQQHIKPAQGDEKIYDHYCGDASDVIIPDSVDRIYEDRKIDEALREDDSNDSDDDNEKTVVLVDTHRCKQQQ